MLYNNGKLITQEEAHELKDKSGLSSSDKEIKVKKKVVKKSGK